MRAFLICAAAATSAAAAPPATLGDPMFYLHDDVYQLAPGSLARWDAGQFAQAGNVLVSLGSVEDGAYDAIERGVVNLPLASKLSLHGEVRNDVDPDARVTRAVVDLLVDVAPGLSIGATGVPAARKQDYGIGGSVLFANASRRRYLLARLVADQFLYNRTNVDGGTRASPVLHAQVQGRWEEGPWSVAGWLDATTESETSFPDAPLVTFEGGSRRELSVRGRYATSALDLSARLDLLRLHDARTELGASSAVRQTAATLRLDGVLPPVAQTRWRPRVGLRALFARADGDDQSGAYEITRREPSLRVAAQREDGPALWELGYALAVPVLRRTGGGPTFDRAPYQDELYGSCDVTFGLVSLRALVSWEAKNARFGGANGAALLQF